MKTTKSKCQVFNFAGKVDGAKPEAGGLFRKLFWKSWAEALQLELKQCEQKKEKSEGRDT